MPKWRSTKYSGQRKNLLKRKFRALTGAGIFFAAKKSPRRTAGKGKFMKRFINVTDQYQNKKILLPISRICFIRERGDGCAVINFEMTATDKECTTLIKKISEIITVETYDKVIAKIDKKNLS